MYACQSSATGTRPCNCPVIVSELRRRSWHPLTVGVMLRGVSARLEQLTLFFTAYE